MMRLETVQNNKKTFADVYIAEMPQIADIGRVYPSIRQQELDEITNAKVKKEKYYVWKLLEYGMYRSLAKKMQEVNFTKNNTGKWGCDECAFSLSHSHNLVCVAISNTSIGVDIEKMQPPKLNIADKVLSDEEKKTYTNLSEEEKAEYLIKSWTKKESLFKQKNVKSLSFEAFRNLDGGVYQKIIQGSDGEYALSVAAKDCQEIQFFDGVEL